jgi:hypothetical protein
VSTYSLRDVVNDGPVRAPRYVHHLIKLATHTALAFAAWCLSGDPLFAAIVAGPVLWSIFVAHEWLWPSDLQPLTHWQHIADWMTDLSLASLPMTGAFLARHEWAAAGFVAGVCVAGWKAGHKDARP